MICIPGKACGRLAMNCIVLAGAPEAEKLDWNDETLSHDFDTPVQRFLGEARPEDIRNPNDTALSSEATPTALLPRWRSVSIPVSREDSQQAEGVDPPQTQFLSFGNDGDATGLQDRRQ